MEPITKVEEVYKVKRVPQLLRATRRNSIEVGANRSHYNDLDRPRNASVFSARKPPPPAVSSSLRLSQVGTLKAVPKLSTNMKLLVAEYPE